MSPVYQFLDFVVNTQNHSVVKNSQAIEITSTTYKLLTCFIENPGKTLSRKTLTDYVWTNKIVSETSLDKLIQRLRQVLGDTATTKKIIATIHGEGFVFLPEVTLNNHEDTISKQNNTKFPKKISLALITVLLLIYLGNDSDKSDEPVLISHVQAQSLMLIPEIIETTTNQQWMTLGGLPYLNDKFKQLASIKAKSISLKTLSTQKPQHYAIELTNKKLSDATLVINVVENKQNFTAHTSLRNQSGLIEEKSFQATSIKTIYDDIFQWVTKALKIGTSDTTHKNKLLSENRFAVENYIRGMSAQATGDAKKAVSYFESATNEDNKFWLAWYQLSISYRKLAQFDKAMSLVKTLENTYVDDEFSLLLLGSKLNIYNAQGEYENAITVANTAIDKLNKASKLNDFDKLSKFLTNKAYAEGQLRQFDKALSSLEQAIDILKNNDANNFSELGSAYSTLSGIQRNLGKITQAEASATQAINYMQKAGNKRYVAKLKLRLSSIAAKQGQWNKAAQLVNDALLTLKELDSSLEEATAYMRLIDYQLLNGEIDEALKNHEQLSELMLDISSKEQQSYFFITTADVMLLAHQLEKAQHAINQLKDHTINDYQLMNYYLLAMRYYKKSKDSKNWLKTANEFTQIAQFNDNPLVYITQAQIAALEGNDDLAIDAYENALTQTKKYQSIRVADKVLNPYIDYLVNNNSLEKAQQILAELEKYNVPVYPYYKTKAQLLFTQGHIFKATTILQELKQKSAQLWSVEDQLLLEKYQSILESSVK